MNRIDYKYQLQAKQAKQLHRHNNPDQYCNQPVNLDLVMVVMILW